MWDSNDIFTASGASKALELAPNLEKSEQRKFLEKCKKESLRHGVLDAKDVMYIYDTGKYL